MSNLINIVSYGNQDIYLTGNPQFSYFTNTYRRHTNYASEFIKNEFNEEVAFGKRLTVNLSKSGDLIKDMFLEFTFGTEFNSSAKHVYGLGNAIIKQIDIEIGGQLIDRQYGEWLSIWGELNTPNGKKFMYDEMVGNFSHFVPIADRKINLDVPLFFWFNKNPGCALPLVCLQQQDIRLIIDLETEENLITGVATSVTNLITGDLDCKLWTKYIFLDTNERRQFANKTQDYLIEQIQYLKYNDIAENDGIKNYNILLPFKHPVKELLWAFTKEINIRGSTSTGNIYPDTNVKLTNPLIFKEFITFKSKVNITVNNEQLFKEQNGNYFLIYQNYLNHVGEPRIDIGNNNIYKNTIDDSSIFIDNNFYIYTYSFAYNPEKYQPSGTLNFSNLKSVNLNINNVSFSTDNGGHLHIFARNYNILRFENGTGKLLYT